MKRTDAFTTPELTRRVTDLAEEGACLAVELFREGRRVGRAEAVAEVLDALDALEAAGEAASPAVLRARIRAIT
ncbi:MAG TPA: hypothetical protein RMH99_07965 [Sandaracinaceae bacterium LLY-WYZ-13_1]|nr:hypothetical protein [Sandaracinaceae bacterium LLY-WYZ-13_1]